MGPKNWTLAGIINEISMRICSTTYATPELLVKNKK